MVKSVSISGFCYICRIIVNRIYFFKMKKLILLPVFLMLACAHIVAQDITQARDASCPGEKILLIEDKYPDMRIAVNFPAEMDSRKKTKIVFYALPNGNTIEWTAGKTISEGDDWHFDIQHIAAQTRFLRENAAKYNYVTVYMMASKKSWGVWRTEHRQDSKDILPAVIADITSMFGRYRPSVTLSSHSGGGYFIFEYIRTQDRIPDTVERIVFLDSTYGYEDSLHLKKLADWLSRSKKHFLNVTSYQDSTVVYNGKPLVSPHGGTWWRSKHMQTGLSDFFRFEKKEDGQFLNFYSPAGRAVFKLKKNPDGEIFHTVLVERNGFIDTILSGTGYQGRGYVFWGPRAYTDLICEEPL